MIPKTIHYIWFGGKTLPKEARRCISSWKEKCPSFRIMRWDESYFNVFEHPFSRAAYEAKAWAFVSDYARLKIIYDEGGIYLDTDVELLKPLDFLLDSDQCYIGQHQGVDLVNTGLGFGAPRHDAAVLSMLRCYDSIMFDPSLQKELACPHFNSKVMFELGWHPSDSVQVLDGATVYPPRFFDPIAPAQGNLVCDDTVSIHHYYNSWGSLRARLRARLIDSIGRDKVIKLRDAIHRL